MNSSWTVSPLAAGDVADLIGRHPLDLEVGLHRRDPGTVGRQRLGQLLLLRRADPRARLRILRDEVRGAQVGQELAATDDDQMFGGDGHLTHEVARHENGPPPRRQRLHELADPDDAFGVEAVHGLVEHHHLRVTEHGGRDAETLGHTEREAANPLLRDLAHARHVEHLVHPLGGDAVGLAQRHEMGPRGATAVDVLGVEQGADLAHRILRAPEALPVDQGLAGLRPVEAQDEPHRRRLARTVRPEETGDDARLNGERQVVDGELVPVALAQTVHLYHAGPLPSSGIVWCQQNAAPRCAVSRPGHPTGRPKRVISFSQPLLSRQEVDSASISVGAAEPVKGFRVRRSTQ